LFERAGLGLFTAQAVHNMTAESQGQNMKAVYIEHFGGPEVVKYGDLPDPVAGRGDIVVDIVNASVNAADWKVRNGQYKQAAFPLGLGRDFSGIVAAAGDGVDDLKPGDEVFGVCQAGQEGAYAEKIAVSAAIVARKPAALSHVNAAALALTGLTAMSAIEDTLRLRRGEKILIQGGAGGVAGFAIQLAKHLGAYVVTTASAANHPYLRSLGADEIIDYNAVDFTKAVRDCDAVFETVGGDIAQRSFEVLKPGGRAAFIASGPQAPKPERTDVESLRPPVGRARRHMERVAQLFLDGIIRAPEITLFPLAKGGEALSMSEQRHFRGKIVLQVR
jgi:NADPH:quinone reductase-like Zn-dependent oxidoreductase